MQLDELIEFLEDEGLRYKENARSLILAACPSCGDGNHKVYFYKEREDESEPLWGKCFACNTHFSSFKYLLESGVEFEKVKALHKGGVKIEDFGKFDILGLAEKRVKAIEEYKPVVHTIDHLFKISDWADHPASKYAVKRGVTPELYDKIMIDAKKHAVAFLCVEDGQVYGYQYRYIRPFNPKMKTWNPPSFQKTQHLIEYPGLGPIAVCEGPFTAISALSMGFHAICTFGAGISARQIEKIKEISSRTGKSVAVAFDKDVAGVEGYFTLKNSLQKMGTECYRILPEVGNDLNDSWLEGKGFVKVENDPLDSSIPVLRFDPFKDAYKR